MYFEKKEIYRSFSHLVLFCIHFFLRMPNGSQRLAPYNIFLSRLLDDSFSVFLFLFSNGRYFLLKKKSVVLFHYFSLLFLCRQWIKKEEGKSKRRVNSSYFLEPFMHVFSCVFEKKGWGWFSGRKNYYVTQIKIQIKDTHR